MKYNDCVKRNHYISNPRFQEKILYEQKLPGMDGFETMEGIRKESSLPILMLTAKNDISSRVRGLRAGADDYLAKSFDMDELIARILALVRRYTRLNQPEGSPRRLAFDGLTIDADARSVTSVHGTFELPPKEFDLLWLLACHQGKILQSRKSMNSSGKRTTATTTAISWRLSAA